MPYHRPSCRRACLTCIGATLACAGFYSLWEALFGCLVDDRTIALLEAGNKADAIRILGQPTIRQNDHRWTFAPFPNQGYVNIIFDDHGHVVSVNDESVFSCR